MLVGFRSPNFDKLAPAQGLPVALLPHCQPLPHITDAYGDPMVIVRIFGRQSLTVNGDFIQGDKLKSFLERVYDTRLSRQLFVSIEGGEYQEAVNVIDRLQSLRATIVLLTPKSREELDRDLMPENDCWLQLRGR